MAALGSAKTSKNAKMNTCIYTKQHFAQSDGEHILQNFLGARWVSPKIVSNEVQKTFGETIDVSLEKGLKDVRNLIGTKGGRGGDGPTLKGIKDKTGNSYNLKPGGIPKIARPIIDSEQRSDGREVVETKVSNRKQLDWLVHLLRQKYPNINIDGEELKNKAKTQRGYPNAELHLQPQIGGVDYFRGLLKSVFNLLGASESQIALMCSYDNVRNFILTGVGDIEEFIRWYPYPDIKHLPSLGNFDHFICVYSRGNNVDGLVQFFGGIGHLIRLSKNYDGPEFKLSYLVDPLRSAEPAEKRNPDYDPNLFPNFDEGYAKPGENVWPVYKGIYERFLHNYMDLSLETEVTRIVDEILESYSGETCSQTVLNELETKLTQLSIR